MVTEIGFIVWQHCAKNSITDQTSQNKMQPRIKFRKMRYRAQIGRIDRLAKRKKIVFFIEICPRGKLLMRFRMVFKLMKVRLAVDEISGNRRNTDSPQVFLSSSCYETL